MIKHLNRNSDIAWAEGGWTEDDETGGIPRRNAGSCSTLLARLLLEGAMTPGIRGRLVNEPGIPVLVGAPTVSWEHPLRRAPAPAVSLRHFGPRDGSCTFRRKPSDGATDLTEAVSAGRRVAVTYQATEARIPFAFINPADVRPRRPTAVLIAAALKALAGRAGEEKFEMRASTGTHDEPARATRTAASIRISSGRVGTIVHRAPFHEAAGVVERNPVLRAPFGRDVQRAYVKGGLLHG